MKRRKPRVAKPKKTAPRRQRAREIFIQVASYRDPQLMPTLRDAVKQANDPSRLHFCVAWQHGDEEKARQFATLRKRTRLTILDIPHSESRGACWARHQIQQQYDGEGYTLQLDSHHRFVAGWDDICIDMVKRLRSKGVAKPLLTAYLPSFDPEKDPEARFQEPWWMTFDRFIPEGAIFFLPATVPDWTTRTMPTRGRFYSAHFAFTLGTFVRDVQHNPEYYFHGEEISIGVRAFTHGYDLFHPDRVVAWHEYTRKGRLKHWDDHTEWGDVNTAAHASTRRLFGMDEFRDQPEVVAAEQRGKFGFGTARTLEDYERYSGICFRRRATTQAVLDSVEPTPDDNRGVSYAEFAASCIPRYRHCLDVAWDRVALDDYDYWCVSFNDANGNSLFRKDADAAEIAQMRRDSPDYCKLWREFVTDVQPKSWMVWPHSVSKGWCPPIIGFV